DRVRADQLQVIDLECAAGKKVKPAVAEDRIKQRCFAGDLDGPVGEVQTVDAEAARRLDQYVGAGCHCFSGLEQAAPVDRQAAAVDHGLPGDAEAAADLQGSAGSVELPCFQVALDIRQPTGEGDKPCGDGTGFRHPQRAVV